MALVPFPIRAVMPKFPPQRYEVSAKAGVAEIILYGVIGDPYDGISAAQFATDLGKLKDATTVNIHINSPGGYCTDGITMYNRLKSIQARKIVHVDGEASSIASLIAMAGDEVRMGEGSLMLIHNAWGITIGNTYDHQDRVNNDLRLMDNTMVAAYRKKTGMTDAAVRALMKEDRYMDAAEAVQLGFADSADVGNQIAAIAVDRSMFGLPALPQTKPRLTRAEARSRMEAVLARGAAPLTRGNR